MSLINSPWVSAHGKLWYDDKPYRLAWIIWPQALAAALVLWFWFAPSVTTTGSQWAKPMDNDARYKQLYALRNDAKTNQSAMDALERAESVAGQLRAAVPRIGELYVTELGAVVGAHLGPGVIGTVVVRR